MSRTFSFLFYFFIFFYYFFHIIFTNENYARSDKAIYKLDSFKTYAHMWDTQHILKSFKNIQTNSNELTTNYIAKNSCFLFFFCVCQILICKQTFTDVSMAYLAVRARWTIL